MPATVRVDAANPDSRSGTSRWRNLIVWAGLTTLVLLGMIASMTRVLAFTEVAAPFTRVRLHAARAMLPMQASEILAMEKSLAENRALMLAHVLAGAVFLMLGLLQFSPRIRSRHPRYHRWSGRLLVLLALVAGMTGLWLGLVAPYSPTERAPVAVSGLLFLLAPALGVAAIRRGDTVRHRQWMIRFFAVGTGIVVVRLVAPPIFWALSPAPARDVIGLTFWIGWGLSLTAGELWIRYGASRLIPSETASPRWSR